MSSHLYANRKGNQMPRFKLSFLLSLLADVSKQVNMEASISNVYKLQYFIHTNKFSFVYLSYSNFSSSKYTILFIFIQHNVFVFVFVVICCCWCSALLFSVYFCVSSVQQTLKPKQVFFLRQSSRS